MRRSLMTAAVACTAVAVMLPAGASSASAARTSTIPAGFRAQSLSWVSEEQGWILGSSSCGSSTCTTVIGTTDGGDTWRRLGTLDAPLTLEDASGVTEIRFADGLHGWAFEPALWATSDGGKTWQQEVPPGQGQQVLALAGDTDAVYAIVTPCAFGQACKLHAQLWRTTPGQGSWTRIFVTLPHFVAYDFAILAVHGVVAYLGVPTCLVCLPIPPDTLDVTVDGTNWTSRPDPCVSQNQESLSGIAPISDTDVALLCVGDPGFGKAGKRVLRSDDTGQTTHSAGRTPYSGIVSQLVATPNGTLAVSSFAVESYIYLNVGGQHWYTPVVYNDAGQGWNDLTFASDQVGYIIHAPVFCCGGHGNGRVWKTEDGGVTWGPA